LPIIFGTAGEFGYNAGMKLRFSIREQFWRVPTWVWVFLAISQFVAFVGATAEIPQLERATARLANDITMQQRWVDVLAKYERERIIAIILFPIFIALAKIRMSRQPATLK
jgi:hypothetical protein